MPNTNIVSGDQFKWDLIDNYIYFYHLETYLMIPAFPTSFTSSNTASWTPTNILTRTAPIYSYSHTNPRSLSFQFDLHRDLMDDLNKDNPEALARYKELLGKAYKENADYVDIFVKYLEASAFPTYDASSKMVNPPVVAVRIGEDAFIKGIITSGPSVGYNLPIDVNNRYTNVKIGFTVTETTPYDAKTILKMGDYRAMNQTLERNVFEDI